MATRNQVKSLVPFSYRFHADEDEAISREFEQLRRRRYLQCCGCFTALLLIVVVTIIVLATTFFHINDPSIRINSATIQHMELFNNGRTIRSDQNITLLADVSVKNPNFASFRYSNTMTTIYYDSKVVGESRIPPGLAKARRTLWLNMTVDIIPEKIVSVPRWSRDILSEALNMSSYTRISGQVKILKIFKKSIAVKVNCTFTYKIKTQSIQQSCIGQR